MHKGPAASLVRIPATDSLYAHQPRPFEDPNLTDPGVPLYTLPTPEQHAALSELLVFNEDKILTWLTVLRSIEPGFRYRECGACLSKQQLDALSTLKDCNDNNISAWLNLSHLAGDVNSQRTLSNISTCRPYHQRQPSKNYSLRSSTSSLVPSAISSTNSSYGTPRSSLGRSSTLLEVPEDIPCNGDPTIHEHWCTYGEHPKPLTTCEGWKRHEREHEVPYLCMPNGPVEDTQQHGKRCALCFKADPSKEHLARHEISICRSQFGEPLKKSRKTDMVEHLAKHGVHSEDAPALADRWRFALNKRNFSCGLCVRVFFSINERSNHIDNEHWRHGQNMGAWELSNCIRGLLLEPKVQAAWRFLLRSYPDVIESNLRWEMPSAGGLQLRLEKGEEHPTVLARATLQLSNHKQIRPSQEDSTATMGREGMMFDPISAAAQSPEATMVVPLPNSTFAQRLPHHRQPRASASRLLPESLSSGNFKTSGMEFLNPQCDPLTSSALFDNSFLSDGFLNNTFLQPEPLLDLDMGETQSQLSTHTFPPEWPSMDTSQPLHDNTQIRGHLIETGTLLLAQMSSPRQALSAAYAISDRQGQNFDSRNDVGTSNTSRLPISNFFHGLTAQYSNHGNSFSSRNKPLPPKPPSDLPGNANPAAEHRSATPMDIDTGSFSIAFKEN